MSVSRFGDVRTGMRGPGSFEADVLWGSLMEEGSIVGQVEPRQWRLQGFLFNRGDGVQGILDDIRLSRELLDTGSAILPYCLLFSKLVPA